MGHYLVTGAAGFIASRVAELLLDGGHSVVGIDNLNDAYDVRMKEYRLRRLTGLPPVLSSNAWISAAGMRFSPTPTWVYRLSMLSSTWQPAPACARQLKTPGCMWTPT